MRDDAASGNANPGRPPGQGNFSSIPASVDVLVVGGGPTGAAAAAHAAAAGLNTLVADSRTFPRDQTCGDGLTPRAMAELSRLGLTEKTLAHTVNRGLKLHGFGGTVTAPWPDSREFPPIGTAVPRTEFDAMV